LKVECSLFETVVACSGAHLSAEAKDEKNDTFGNKEEGLDASVTF